MTDTDHPRDRPEEVEAIRFRKKPVVIEAVQFTGPKPLAGAPRWLVDAIFSKKVTTHAPGVVPGYLLIKTLEGVMRAEVGDWIIRGVKGEIYPCKPDIFALTYEPEAAAQSQQRVIEGADFSLLTAIPTDGKAAYFRDDGSWGVGIYKEGSANRSYTVARGMDKGVALWLCGAINNRALVAALSRPSERIANCGGPGDETNA